ncbi:hypothetical protein JCM10049v2_000336 [Rhodotorula toruloides]
MAHRLSRTWQSISSLVPFLAPSPSPSHSQAHYAAIPLTTTTSSKSNDGLHGVDDDEKLLGLGAGVQVPRRHWLVLAWTYLSPFLVLLLAASIYVDRKRTALARMTVVNPYACGPKSNFTTLEAVCRAGTGPERQKAENYELALDRHLTQQQCDAIYPGLYLEIERARDYWKARGGVTEKDLDEAEQKGQARVQIINNRMYVKSYSNEQPGTRTKATLALINEALITSPEPVPDIEFVIQTGDNGIPQGAPWSLGRKEKEEQLTLMPDYSFFSWPEPQVNSWQEVADHCRDYESHLRWEDKVDQLLWRGAFLVDIRKELWEIARKYPWGAVSDLDWGDRDSVNKLLLTPEQHCQWKFLAHVEGYAYSGRLKYLTQCRSVIVAHKMRYVQHFHHLFNSDPTSPSQNIVISPGRNFDNIASVMSDLLSDDAKAKKIADTSYEFWQHWLSVGSVACYWRRLFREWKEVMAFEPVLKRDVASYNSFILMGQVHWDAPAHLNFYRLHLLVFTFVPLIASGIFFASNGPSNENQISYVDALFMCTSAMTVTGLNTVVLSALTVWQQVMLFLLMTIGSTSFVSILVIVIRRQFFRNKFEYMVANDAEARKRVNEVGEQEAARAGRAYRAFDASHRPGHTPWYSDFLPGQHSAVPSPRPSPFNSAAPTRQDGEDEERQRKKKKKRKVAKLRTDMIKRVDVPVRVNKMNVSGWLGDEKHEGEERMDEEVHEMKKVREAHAAEEEAPAEARGAERTQDLPEVFSDDDQDEEEVPPPVQRHDGELADSPRPASPEPVERANGVAGHTRAIQIDTSSRPDRGTRGRRSSDSVAAAASRAPGAGFPRTRTFDHRHLDGITESPSPLQSPSSPTFRNRDLDVGRTRTIEFRDPSEAGDLRLRRNRTHAVDPDYPVTRRMSQSNLRDRTFIRTTTVDQAAMHSGFGGFPNPIYAAASLAKSKIPALRNAVERTSTMPRTTTMLSTHSHGGTSSGGVKHEGTGNFKPVSYITFDAVVGRNSKFHGLTTAQQEELGGVEYRALTVLLRIVFAYWLGVQLLSVLVLAPWLSTSERWAPITRESNANPTWFTFFQVWSAYSNLGMSLVDTSMIPFQRAYWLIIVQGFLILAGNTAFPVFLRLLIWTVYKVMPSRSRTRETLQFLLDHPRRCFIYLFPSHQTWFLVFMLVCLNGIDWASFLILDIGNPEIEALPTRVRVLDGLFQAFAVRAAGFSIVPLASVAPALQLLYVIMMYIAVYPIAVSIRSTNVYEEKSMGVYDDDFDEDPDLMEARFDKSHSATEYISYHARKQLAFDLWWLGLAVWLICIVERHRIGSTDWPEVTIFTLIFEIVSAYGTVGLSLGNGRNNASLAGVLSTLSKLIICAVMVRGRHRGLPIAIDRAVLLPSDLEKHGDDTATTFSFDNLAREPSLRTRRTRTSFSSHTAVAGGGLQAVEPLTDEHRFERSRRFSDDQHDVGNGELAPGSSPSDSKDSALDGKEPSLSTADDAPQGMKGEGPPIDRNQTGWV